VTVLFSNGYFGATATILGNLPGFAVSNRWEGDRYGEPTSPYPSLHNQRWTLRKDEVDSTKFSRREGSRAVGATRREWILHGVDICNEDGTVETVQNSAHEHP
jgi:hypothetical protein